VYTLAGGAVVIVAVATHEALAFREEMASAKEELRLDALELVAEDAPAAAELAPA
jgi:hypothetical protein